MFQLWHLKHTSWTSKWLDKRSDCEKEQLGKEKWTPLSEGLYHSRILRIEEEHKKQQEEKIKKQKEAEKKALEAKEMLT